jgi:hypothetical protein
MVPPLRRAAEAQSASAPDAAGSTPLAIEAPSTEADIAAADREQADLERLADLVYAIIERRLKFERENLGL